MSYMPADPRDLAPAPRGVFPAALPATRGLTDTVTFVVEGSTAAAAQTALDLGFGGGEAFAVGNRGVPVMDALATDLEIAAVAVSWLSDTDPGGDWTLRLWKRPSGSVTASEVATFTVATA